MRRHALATLLLVLPLPVVTRAQGVGLTVHDVGVAIGDRPRVTGLRLNYRDRNLEEVEGVNATLWFPYDPPSGVVRGVALGLPGTGAARIEGVALAVFGVGVGERLDGVAIAPLGVGSGGSVRGIMLGGLGAGAGTDVEGIGVGGLGIGAGRDVRWVTVGGLGVGAGRDVDGLAVGGLGVGAGRRVRGVAVGLLGAGAGGDVTGILLGGVGVGAGGDVTGLAVGGLGVGSGGTVRGLAIGGVGVGAPRISGVALSAVGVGGVDVRGLVVAPAYFRIVDDGSFRGGAVGVFNRVSGTQRGLTIGVVNYARELHGAQIGLVNIVNGRGGRRVVPILNVGR